MIAHDHRSTSLATASALVLGLSLLMQAPAVAHADAPLAPLSAATAAASLEAAPTFLVSLTRDGKTTIAPSNAPNVGAFLVAAGISVTPGDYVSHAADTPLTDGLDIVFRSAKNMTIVDGTTVHTVRSSAASIAEVVRLAGVAIDRHVTTAPAPSAAPSENAVIHIKRTSIWMVRRRQAIAAHVRMRASRTLAAGQVRTLDPGAPGVRETTTRLERDPAGRVVRTILASRIIRAPRARVLERGVAVYTTLAQAAERGFSSALRFAGSAIKMVATAYTASCYGCSGYTASGAHAGLGVIAVDPTIIPLGTRLFIPGYGRAVAGDTGGAIRGHRVDLGMNTVADAMRFGRRPVTVYVLR